MAEPPLCYHKKRTELLTTYLPDEMHNIPDDFLCRRNAISTYILIHTKLIGLLAHSRNGFHAIVADFVIWGDGIPDGNTVQKSCPEHNKCRW